jgi:hypothetical protein
LLKDFIVGVEKNEACWNIIDPDEAYSDAQHSRQLALAAEPRHALYEQDNRSQKKTAATIRDSRCVFLPDASIRTVS